MMTSGRALVAGLTIEDGSGGAAAGGGAGQGGGTAEVPDIFGGGSGDGAGAASGEGGSGGASGESAGAGDGGAPPAWLESFSADAIGEDPSHREWLSKKGFKTLDDVAKSYRELEKWRGANGSRIEVPKEGASPEVVAAYRAARGVPEKPEDYSFSLPEGVTGELSEDLIGSFRQAAHKVGLSAAEASQLVKDWYIPLQLDMDSQAVSARNAERDAKFKEWGASKDMNVALCNRAAAQFGFNGKDVGDIQAAIGTARTLDFFKKLGDGMAEDAMIEGGRGKFGLTVAEAKTQKDAMLSDPATAQKIRDKDPATVQRLDRLQTIIADDMDRQAGRRAA